MDLTPLDPMEVYKRGLGNPDALTPDERMVCILMTLEDLADMEGWDDFFTTDKVRYYGELKEWLKASGDGESLEVLEDYERHFQEHGVAFEASAIVSFLSGQGDEYFRGCRDWRADFSRLCERRWRRVEEHLRERGIELVT